MVAKRKRSLKETDDLQSDTQRRSRTFTDGPSSPAGAGEDSATASPNTTLDMESFRVPNLPGANVFYIQNFAEPDDVKAWYEELAALDTWYHPTLKVYGRAVRQSRAIAAYAMSERVQAHYSGHTVQMHTVYPPALAASQARVEAALGEKFNHAMMNWYADGSEYIGKHRDTRENGVIASLSLGAERAFVLYSNCGGKTMRFPLAPGSLLVMRGDTQENYKHEIPKQARVRAGRISITFRQLPEE